MKRASSPPPRRSPATQSAPPKRPAATQSAPPKRPAATQSASPPGSPSPVPTPETFTAKEVVALLGIRPQTLYAYVSRGLIWRAPGDVGREHRYLRADVERLRGRKTARSGHGPAAADALHWGAPVLESRITAITDAGPLYRGEPAVALAQAGRSFEEVAEWLWAEDGRPAAVAWPSAARGLASLSRLRPLLEEGARPFDGLALVCAALAARDEDRFNTTPAATLRGARALLPRIALGVALAQGAKVLRAAADAADGGVAATLLAALGGAPSPAALRAMDAALVLSADHELNTSAFVARVVASTGADLYAIVGAALGAVAGPQHGGACDRAEALLDEAVYGGDVVAMLRERARRGDAIVGFGHPFYPEGDPRGRVLMALAADVGRRPCARAVAAQQVVAQMGTPPSIDFALVALCDALGLPDGSALAVFSVGRAAGWIAHALEQRAQGSLLRPRAHYTGR